ncbi:hypothetical protein ACS0TY_026286 [Phlomoides rotata]
MDDSVSELLIARSLGVPSRPPRRRVPISVRWRPPQAGWYKVNVDGSVSSTPSCMYAGVWRFLWVESDSSLAMDTVQKKTPLIPWRIEACGVEPCLRLLT